MNRLAVPLEKSYLLLNHGPVTLISSAHQNNQNVMSASWAMPLDFDPPKVVVVIDKNTYTRQLIEASGEFVINIPCKQMAQTIIDVGSETGTKVDKIQQFKLATGKGSHVRAPLMEGCIAWLECKVIQEPHNQQKYDLFIAQVMAAWADDRVFKNGRWNFEDENLRTLHYAAGGQFFETSNPFQIKTGSNFSL